MTSPKAEEFRQLYKSIVTELKKKFEYNLGFLLNCSDYFCWNLKRNTRKVCPSVLDKFSELMKKLENLQNIRIQRLLELKKTIKCKELFIKNEKKLKEINQVNELKQLFYFFPNLREKRINYIKDSLLLLSLIHI